jgi:hypothetical protein
MNKWTLGQLGKTNPIQTQFKPNTNPKQTQNKPNSNPIQTQYKPKTNPIQTQYKPKQTQFPNFPRQWFLIAISGKNKYAHESDAQRYETV